MNKVITLVLMILSINVAGQNKIVFLSFDDFVALANKNSHKINAVDLSLKEAVTDAELAKLNAIPNLVYTGYYGFLWGTNFNLVTNQRSPYSTQNTSLTMQLQTPLYSGGQRQIINSKAFNTVSSLQSLSKDERFQLSISLINLYYKEAFYKDYINISDKILQISKQQFFDSQLKYQLGSIAKDEFEISHSSYLEDLQKQTENKIADAFLENQLKEYMGLKNASDSIVFVADTTERFFPALIDDEIIYKITHSDNKLAAQHQLIENAKLDLKQSARRPYPQLYLVGGLATNYDKLSSLYFGNFGEQLKNNLGYYVQVAMAFSLSSVITSKKHNQKFSLEVEKQIQIEEEMEKQLRLTIQNLLLTIKTLKEKNNTLNKLSKNYEIIYNMSVEKLKFGRISQIDFLQVKNKYTSFLSSYMSSKYELILNSKILMAYLNTGNAQ